MKLVVFIYTFLSLAFSFEGKYLGTSTDKETCSVKVTRIPQGHRPDHLLISFKFKGLEKIKFYLDQNTESSSIVDFNVNLIHASENSVGYYYRPYSQEEYWITLDENFMPARSLDIMGSLFIGENNTIESVEIEADKRLSPFTKPLKKSCIIHKLL